MKIYFTASLTGKSKFGENYRNIVNALEQLGHKVISEHIFDSSAEVVRKEPLEKRLDYLRYLNLWLTKCDLLVAETSFPSTSVGFEICWALRKGVPVLVLHGEAFGFPPVLIGFDDERLQVESYNEENLSRIVKRGLEAIAELPNERFTMLLPRDLKKYLDGLAEGGMTTRSDYIRRLIDKDMRGK